jgi:uncharacterized protein YndB with AHSA1/START domain
MDKNELVYVTFIRTTPEKLWAALTKPEFTRQYWGGGENDSDWKPGSKWQHLGDDAQRSVRVVGEVLESTPPKRLVLTWVNPADATDKSRVTFELEELEDLVRLQVAHGDFKAGSDMGGNVSWGWPRVLSSLKSFLETGQGINVWAGHRPNCAKS